MPRNRDSNAKNELDIYVILSEISEEFIVWKIKSGNAYTAYKDHARLKSLYTKDLFLRSIEQMKMPKMYLLETVNCSQREAMKHCIVWTKYFRERGKTPLAGEVMVNYADTLDEQSLVLYEEIKDRSFEEIINPETAIVENYRSKSWSKDTNSTTEKQKNSKQIKIVANPEQYQIIQKKADYLNMPIAKYGRTMMVNGFVFRFDFAEYLDEIRRIKRVIQDIQEAIYQSGRYFPSDLENLEKCIDEVNDVQRKMLKDTLRIIKKQATAMPEGLYEEYED
jgi:hypothetical protein